MDTVRASVDSDKVDVTLDVPSGDNRVVEVFAYTESVTSYAGEEVDLEAGAEKEFEVELRLLETKLVVPDYLNRRVLQFDDISGAGMTELIGSVIGLSGEQFGPYDVDFDHLGRIYICNYLENDVVRVDDIRGGNPYFFTPSPGSAINALAVDRQRGY